jgi:broad specificity phosphatase PhoE
MSDFRALTLYVIRHGECEHNAAGWAAGHDDSPLTERGRTQARANGRVLREIAPRLDDLDFFASSLHRTCNTMELLREEIGLPPTGYHADRRLMEGSLGDHSRLPVSDVAARDGGAGGWDYVRPGGESLAMIHARVGGFLEQLKRDSVLVTHMMPVAMLRAHYLGLSPAQTMGYHMGNAGVMRLSMGTEALFGK